MKRYILWIMILFCSLKVYSQQESIQRVNIKSPEVAAFQRAGEIPVNLYTGIPQISFPIYEVRSGNLKLPITLDYHASAILVNQESSWVGLNWLLNAGGVITTRTTKPNAGGFKSDWDFLYNKLSLQSVSNDDLGQTYKMDGCHEMGWRGKYGFNRFKCLLIPTTTDISFDIYSRVLDNYEGEAQSYSANFMGYSFEFIYHPLQERFIITGKDQKFKIIGDNTAVNKIIDANGIEYTFGKVEVNAPEAYTTAPYAKRSTSFYLTQIKHPNGKTINLTYKEYDYIRLLPEVLESWYLNYTNEPNYFVNKRLSDLVKINNCYLYEIKSDDATVRFNVGTRTDLKGGRKLDNIEIMDRSEKLLKRFSFTYDYLQGNDVGGNRLYEYYKERNQLTSYNSTYSNTEINSRLSLSSFNEETKNDKGVIVKNPPHKFSYNSGLPGKSSSARDYWGNYNGKSNQTLLAKRSNSVESQYNNYPETPLNAVPSADRRFNPSTINAGLLSSIIYPTGGNTSFSYEPHSFTNYLYLNVNQSTSQQSLSLYAMTSNTNSTIPAENTKPIDFTTTEEMEVEVKVSWKNPTVLPWKDMLGSPALLFVYKTTITPNGPVESNYPYKTWPLTPPDTLKANGMYVTCVERFLLPAGRYQLRPTISSPQITPYPNFPGDKRVEMWIKKTSATVSNGAGVRVKEIQQTDNNGNTMTTQYDYSDESGITSGLLMSPLHFARKKLQVYQQDVKPDQSNPVYAQLKEYWIVSSENMAISKGVPVGYSRVSVKRSNNGKTVYEYWNRKNSANYSFDYCPPLNDPRNGNLMKESTYNSSNTLQKEISNTYTVLQKEHHHINAIIDDIYYGPGECGGDRGNIYATLCNGGRVLFCIYPSSRFWIECTKQVVKEYKDNGVVTTEHAYTYNPWNLSLSTVKTTIDSNWSETTHMLYPQNYNTSGNTYPYTLVNKHILNAPTEIVKVVNRGANSFVVSGELNRYNDNGQLISHSKFKLDKPLSISNFKFSNKSLGQIGTDTLNRAGYSPSSDYVIDASCTYTANGNLADITEKQTLTTVYLWSYNKQYLIAEITNTTYAKVKEALGYTSDAQISTLEAQTTPNVADIRNNLDTYYKNSSAQITTYTYTPLVGVATKTDPNGNVTNYNYDAFGHLQNITDNTKKTIQSYEYNYKN